MLFFQWDSILRPFLSGFSFGSNQVRYICRNIVQWRIVSANLRNESASRILNTCTEMLSQFWNCANGKEINLFLYRPQDERSWQVLQDSFGADIPFPMVWNFLNIGLPVGKQLNAYYLYNNRTIFGATRAYRRRAS